MIDLAKIKKIHFIGIGGIGISAVARMLALEGKEVSGSDTSFAPVALDLENIGVIVKKNYDAKNVPEDSDLVVYNLAVEKDNPEILKSNSFGIKVVTYPEMLGVISKDKYTIAISGTHGKTTTTAMVAKILKDNGLDPTVIVGSMLKGENSNFIAGKGPYLVVEACEYRRSFLNINPNIVVITNVDNDHLDYYKDIYDIQEAFKSFSEKLGKEDYLIANVLDFNVRPVVSDTISKLVDYSGYRDFADSISAPGEHNKSNAAAAIAVAHVLGIPTSKAVESLKDFKGTWRRFEKKGETKTGAIVYDDYAHHPTEVKATLAAARGLFPKENIIVAFQPHLFSRTKNLLDEFAGAFTHANEVLLAPIYAAREKDEGEMTSEMLKDVMKTYSENVKVFDSLEELQSFADKNLKTGDVFITMGAGDIYKVGESILEG